MFHMIDSLPDSDSHLAFLVGRGALCSQRQIPKFYLGDKAFFPNSRNGLFFRVKLAISARRLIVMEE